MMTINRFYKIGLAVELVILVLLLAGCMKEPDYKQDFGPEIQWSQISTELVKIQQQTPDYTSAKQGEFAYSELVQKIEDLQPTVIAQQAYTLKSVTDDSSDPSKYMVWKIVKEVGELQSNGHMKVSSSEDEKRLIKPGADDDSSVQSDDKAAQTGTYAAPYFQVRDTSKSSEENAKPASTDNRISYHNLQVKNIAVEVPPLVLRRPNCGGLPAEKCGQPIPATKISFDQVEWKGDKGYKVSVSWTFATDFPFFATVRNYDNDLYFTGLISDCIETVAPYQDQQLNIIQCHDIKDFTFGSN